jgi:sec-independent protein translocase protein TatC
MAAIADGRRYPGGGAVADGSRMTVLEHLKALRRVLVVSSIAWTLTTLASFLLWSRLLEFLVDRGGLHDAYYQTPTGAFALALKVSLYMGFVLASPVVIQQVWWFVSPALHRHERRLALPLMLATLAFFMVGIAFALAMLPIFVHVLSGFAPRGLHYLPFVDDYLSFVLVLVVGFGLVFELPVVLFTLGLLRIVTSRWLYANRLYWIVGLGVLSALGTPGADPVTPLFMFVPLYVFWEGAALLLKLSGR